MMHDARYDAAHGERLEIWTSKEMFQRLPRALPQVKAASTSANLLIEICQIIIFFVSNKRNYQQII